MTTDSTSSPGLSPTERRAAARTALDVLGGQRAEHLLCMVRCSRSHHVAAVYDTAAGPVYASISGPHAHGHRDFVDTGHHGRRAGTTILDLLDAGTGSAVNDELPAWCECGPRTLSRADLQNALDEHRSSLILT